jgi:F0F1-type ATP synthase assembly protein I
MVLGVVLPCYLGSLADDYYGTSSVFVLLGLFFGLAHAVRVVWRAVQKGNREVEQAEQAMKKKRAEYYAKRD